MSNKTRNKIKLILVITVCIAFLATGYVSLFGEVTNENLVHSYLIEVIALIGILFTFFWGNKDNDEHEPPSENL